jgi:aerobic-type carbon monoxide dehydrogenase small subunit (CoxS/CutS family)
LKKEESKTDSSNTESKTNNKPSSPKLGESLKVSRRGFIKATLATVGVVGTAAAAVEAQSLLVPSGQSSVISPDYTAVRTITLTVNGVNYTTQVEPRDMLVNVLRENLGLTGTKRPCNRMECGGCTVVIDGKAYYSCTYMAIRAQGKQILTVEGGSVDPVLNAIQQAWVPTDASQCGYCQPGRIMAATALLKSNPNPTVDQIKTGIAGNLCRCGTYLNVIEAVQLAAKNLAGGA